MRRWKIVVGAVAGLAVAIQIIPVDRSNPPVEEPLPLPPEVAEIVRTSCYDCHSHETRWPWYGYVAPASWLVARDVREGRDELNLSTWTRYDAEERAENFEEMWEVIEEGEMPPWFYTPLHPGAKLSDAERAALRAWLGAGQPGGGRDAADADDEEERDGG
jgi:hypothetical protein